MTTPKPEHEFVDPEQLVPEYVPDHAFVPSTDDARGGPCWWVVMHDPDGHAVRCNLARHRHALLEPAFPMDSP